MRKQNEKELLQMYDVYTKAGRELADSGMQRLTKEEAEKLNISPAEARHRIVQGFEIEAKARGITLETEEVDVEGKINVIFTEDLNDA
jgi:isopentenyl diphosphate isomerase/L-lactate dehydrogenase-like FMN-dependent dehydrogenase